MDYRRYTLFNVVGGIAWIWSMLFIGYFLGRYIPGVDQHIELGDHHRDLPLAAARDHWLAADARAASDERPANAIQENCTWRSRCPPLPYANDALEPHIDAQTMEIHHDKHHQAYVNNLNAAIEKAPELAGKSLDDLMRGINSVPEAVRTAVRNNGGGHWNHSMFWEIMGAGKGGEPIGQAGRRDQERVRRLQQSSRSSSPPPAPDASAQAGRGWSTTAASSRSRARRTRTIRSWKARRRSSASTSGSMRTT